MRWIFAALLFVYAASLGQAVYQFTVERGYDTPILYREGRGEEQPRLIGKHTGRPVPGWVWSDHLVPVLRLWSKLDYQPAFYVLHMANSLGLAALMFAVVGRVRRYPYLASLAVICLGWVASKSLAGGNVSAMLAGAALTPVGALAVCCVKPWFGLPFALLHAVSIAGRGSQGVLSGVRGGGAEVGQCGISGGAVRGSDGRQ